MLRLAPVKLCFHDAIAPGIDDVLAGRSQEEEHPMKKTLKVICAALMISAPLASFAQPGPPQGGQPGRPHQAQHPGHQQAPKPGHDHGYRDPSYRPQPGMPVPHTQWKRGHVVDRGYRGDRYWVTDWRARHLPAPPHDHRWLHINGDYVLVAIPSGVIMNILPGY